MNSNTADAIIILLALIATCCVVVGIWVIYMSIVIDRHLIELQIRLTELQIRWIDTFGEEDEQ